MFSISLCVAEVSTAVERSGSLFVIGNFMLNILQGGGLGL